MNPNILADKRDDVAFVTLDRVGAKNAARRCATSSVAAGGTSDRAELETLINRFLRAVSFEEGEQPAYGDLHDLFVDGARLIKNCADTPEISTVGAFIRPRQETVDAGELTSFEEVEVAEITEIFGNVGHRLSTYEKRGTMNGVAIEARGAISTQFIRTPDGWRMSSLAWDDERPGLALPARYNA